MSAPLDARSPVVAAGGDGPGRVGVADFCAMFPAVAAARAYVRAVVDGCRQARTAVPVASELASSAVRQAPGGWSR